MDGAAGQGALKDRRKTARFEDSILVASPNRRAEEVLVEALVVVLVLVAVILADRRRA
jgi:hypothetical protein